MHIITRGQSIFINDGLINVWIPGIWNLCTNHTLDLERLSDILHSRNRLIRTLRLSDMLESFFDLFANRRSNDRYLGADLHALFKEVMNLDIREMSRHMSSDGLSRSLSCISALSALAELTQSRPLAQILVEAFSRNRDSILTHELSRNLPFWALAIESLRGLVHSCDISRCIRYLQPRCDDICQYCRDLGASDPRIDAVLNILYQMNAGMMDWQRGRGLQNNLHPTAFLTAPEFASPAQDWCYGCMPSTQAMGGWRRNLIGVLDNLDVRRRSSPDCRRPDWL
ncbi:hypothetical protein DM02DRAFT_700255 [Periconia macrospinosa]|uniref:Uncharacterized protein n=1 Tax=Periconia macrospinosa TaxID=97972 RepID=A0A2V1D2W4_9PLEO|nr:hypothetical protein DM02DRAFT_700255 [Periconia macrospinosa]